MKVIFIKITVIAVISFVMIVAFPGLSGNDLYAEPVIEDTIVYSDYYPWYSGASWRKGYSNTPYLGLYNSLDKKVLEQHAQWANQYGIDVFKVEYILSRRPCLDMMTGV